MFGKLNNPVSHKSKYFTFLRNQVFASSTVKVKKGI